MLRVDDPVRFDEESDTGGRVVVFDLGDSESRMGGFHIVAFGAATHRPDAGLVGQLEDARDRESRTTARSL